MNYKCSTQCSGITVMPPDPEAVAVAFGGRVGLRNLRRQKKGFNSDLYSLLSISLHFPIGCLDLVCSTNSKY
ncbi:hypothetical protein L484_019102 [Morus notabilis]|uniref:Uncharacterized protein n=1 Tax=Morus notabilis TaxID=981085 RepID=W9SZH1_9ROSA|nr:hypothetical protein L484_019102 [Morus notabilis]